MTERFGRLMMLGALLGVSSVAVGAADPTPTPVPGHRSRPPCVFGDPQRPQVNPQTPGTEPCAPFTRVGIKIRTVFPSGAFGADSQPSDIGVLGDGSAMVQTNGYGLDRIAGGRVQKLWPSNKPCIPSRQSSFAFAGSFDDQMLLTLHLGSSVAVRADGSLTFRLPRTPDSAVQDANGVVWLVNGKDPGQTLYAYFPKTRTLKTVPFSNGIFSLFRSPNGRVYASNSGGLYELDSYPALRTRIVHGPMQVKGAKGDLSDLSPIQAVGADGSLWASTPAQVIHQHPNGTTHIMRFSNPATTLMERLSSAEARPTPISLTMTRDGSVWNTGGMFVRIGNDDRIEVASLPTPADETDTVRLGSDSSIWVFARDTGSPYTARGVVNLVLGGPRNGTAWPFTSSPPTPEPTVMTPCPPPPTPIPPLPPQSGSVNFVYVANVMSRDVWGYWTDTKGNLTPVRGSPLSVATAEHFTIDPSGRHLYVGTTYDGILAYAIDARSGTLRAVPGSPFAAGSGSLVLIDHLGRYAYSANRDGKNFTGYAIDRLSGALRPLAWSPLTLNRWPFRMQINPQRNIGYVATSKDIQTFYANGAAPRPIASLPLGSFGGIDILVDPRGRWAYLSSDNDGTIAIYGVDQRSGALVPPSSPPIKAGNEPRAMAIDPSGRFLYVTNIPKKRTGPTILGYRIDSQTGALHELPTSPFSGAAAGNGITITPDGAFLYATNFGGKTITGFAIDQRTGALWRLPHSPFKAGNIPDNIISCRRVGDRCKTAP